MMTINANASEMVTERSASSRHHLTRLSNCCARAVAAIIGLLAVTELAWGADLSTPPLAPVPYSWSGLYIGLNAGYTSAKVTDTVRRRNGQLEPAGRYWWFPDRGQLPNRRSRVGL